jgi:hypothetical protein
MDPVCRIPLYQAAGEEGNVKNSKTKYYFTVVRSVRGAIDSTSDPIRFAFVSFKKNGGYGARSERLPEHHRQLMMHGSCSLICMCTYIIMSSNRVPDSGLRIEKGIDLSYPMIVTSIDPETDSLLELDFKTDCHLKIGEWLSTDKLQ